MPSVALNKEESWRKSLAGRLRDAMKVLQGKTPLTKQHKSHCLAFKRLVAEDQNFQSEIQSLNPLELELLSISNTKQQLESGGNILGAKEASEFFTFGVDTKRRHGVQEQLHDSAEYQAISKAFSASSLGKLSFTRQLLS